MSGKGLNKGNWSELFTFLKVVSERQLQLADRNLTPIPGKTFAVRQVLKNDAKTNRTYDISDHTNIAINIFDEPIEINSNLDYEVIEKAVPLLLEKIKAGTGYFKIPEVDSLLKLLNYGPVVADSKDNIKSDIKIVIHDYVTNLPNEVDFSVKSFIGAKPTLFNAGKNTTPLIFKVVGKPLDVDTINSISGGAKVQKRFKAIADQGCKLEFSHILNPQFQKNLRKVDSLMPIFLSEYVRAYYTTKARTLVDLTKEVEKSKVITELLDVPFSYEDIKFKIKQLLINSALGMVAGTDWDGFYQADGGYIVIKKEGDMVCFHIYNIAELGEYLFNGTIFDTPSTSEKKFHHAFLFEQDGSQYFRINFQIKFK